MKMSRSEINSGYYSPPPSFHLFPLEFPTLCLGTIWGHTVKCDPSDDKFCVKNPEPRNLAGQRFSSYTFGGIYKLSNSVREAMETISYINDCNIGKIEN